MTKVVSVILNDLHAGSRFSPGPDQPVLMDFFKKLAKKWRNPDKLILNGDLIDGLQYRSNLDECWTTDLQKQADFAREEEIKPYGAKTHYVIRGTPYHTQTKGVDLEEYIGKQLGAVKENVLGEERYSTQFKLISMAPKGAQEPKVLHFAHHLAGSKWFAYYGSALAREMNNMMLNESHWVDRQVHGKVWGIVRAHVHYFWYAESDSRIMLVCPPWQLATPFVNKIHASSPPLGSLGAVRITVHEDGTYDVEKELLKTKELLPKVW